MVLQRPHSTGKDCTNRRPDRGSTLARVILGRLVLTNQLTYFFSLFGFGRKFQVDFKLSQRFFAFPSLEIDSAETSDRGQASDSSIWVFPEPSMNQ
jgi:hypothetical protein